MTTDVTKASHDLYAAMKRCTNSEEVKSLTLAIALLNSLVYDVERCPICNGEMSAEWSANYGSIVDNIYFSYCKSCEYVKAHF